MNPRHAIRLLLLSVPMLLAACTAFWQTLSGHAPREGTSSSLVEFLYPTGQEPPPPDGVVPHLDLPVRVGIAFVPATSDASGGLSEARKVQLLDNTRKAFLDRDFISAIEIVPETYLRTGRGFAALDQVARLYDLDVIALVSYDQVAISDDTRASLLYWTIVGAYFIKGSRHDVQTFVDTAVFDVATHRLLFRAPGTNTLEETSTLIESPEALRQQRDESFATAMSDMTGNLVHELDVFKDRVEKEGVITVAKEGGGATGFAFLGLLLLALGLVRRHSG